MCDHHVKEMKDCVKAGVLSLLLGPLCVNNYSTHFGSDMQTRDSFYYIYFLNSRQNHKSIWIFKLPFKMYEKDTKLLSNYYIFLII